MRDKPPKRPPGKRISGRWAQAFECCQDCGTTEHPHGARGLCVRCYGTRRYRANIEREHSMRKARRIATNDYEVRRPKVVEWLRNHVEHNRSYKAAWARKHSKWQIGLTVFFLYDERDWVKAPRVRGIDGRMQSGRPPSKPVQAKGKIVGRGQGGKSVIVKSHGHGLLEFGTCRMNRLLSLEPPSSAKTDLRIDAHGGIDPIRYCPACGSFDGHSEHCPARGTG